jgi:hypothetical protein
MLSWGFATEVVYVRGGLMFREQEQKGLNGAENTKRASTRAVMLAREPTVDLAALGFKDKAYLFSSFRQRRGGAPPNVAHSSDQCEATLHDVKLRVLS